MIKLIIANFRFDYEYMFDYEHNFLAFDLVMLTTRYQAILVEKRKTVTRFDPTTILRTHVTHLVDSKKSYW